MFQKGEGQENVRSLGAGARGGCKKGSLKKGQHVITERGLACGRAWGSKSGSIICHLSDSRLVLLPPQYPHL